MVLLSEVTFVTHGFTRLIRISATLAMAF